MKLAIGIFSIIVSAFFHLYTTLTVYEAIATGLFIWVILDLIKNIGERLVILDMTVFLASLTWLLMPVVFYHYYTRENWLAFKWVKYMSVPSDEYFSYVLPGTIALIIGLRLKIGKRFNSRPWLMSRIHSLRTELKGKHKIGFILISVGLIANLLEQDLESAFQYIVFLFGNLTYVGVMYMYFSDFKYRKQVLIAVITVSLLVAMMTSMFGKTLITLTLVFVVLSLEFKISFIRKFVATLVLLSIVLIIQSVKPAYRDEAWKKGNAGPLVYLELISERLKSPAELFNTNNLFWVSVRLNQGWLIAGTLYFVPQYHPFAEGETIRNSLLAVMVPRFLWPDKPQAGGKYNLKRFWGFELRGFSMNIGPISEGYANYGRTGGVFFMFFYGLFFNLMMWFILRKSERSPKIFCWLPFLFFFSVGVETDMLSTINALVKNCLFMVAIVLFFDKLLRIKLI